MTSGFAPDVEQMSFEQIDLCVRNGINFFDTAEIYGAGNAEIIMGKAFKELNCRREELVITTKFISCGSGVNDKGLGMKHLSEGINNSLKRLQLDYVDVAFAHRPDIDIPIGEVCRGFNAMIEDGKTFYWATSEWPPELIVEAIMYCEKHNLHKPIADQCQYNALVRTRFEKEYEFVFERFGYGTTIWSPLASGILSGKYNEGVAPEDSRIGTTKFAADNIWPKYFGETTKDKTIKTLKALAEIAKEQGVS
jgi:aryl-alcohol dehydrogenase-like predicted oxidoreductase